MQVRSGSLWQTPLEEATYAFRFFVTCDVTVTHSCRKVENKRQLTLQITLTTHADGSTGYLIYLDGNLAASLPSTDPKALNATLDNVNLLLDGGRPIFLEVCLTPQ